MTMQFWHCTRRRACRAPSSFQPPLTKSSESGIWVTDRFRSPSLSLGRLTISSCPIAWRPTNKKRHIWTRAKSTSHRCKQTSTGTSKRSKRNSRLSSEATKNRLKMVTKEINAATIDKESYSKRSDKRSKKRKRTRINRECIAQLMTSRHVFASRLACCYLQPTRMG